MAMSSVVYPRAAHPRAGGENVQMCSRIARAIGSSPRGRGKLCRLPVFRCVARLIPARAGKTTTTHATRSRWKAHPRAGGENSTSPSSLRTESGSSPRGRGKPPVQERAGDVGGLIPARAGKTLLESKLELLKRAHPRAGGENGIPTARVLQPGGSSPRGRGKRRVHRQAAPLRRLIPARAGKTPTRTRCRPRTSAHPRAGGENATSFG